jgi:hypothetical protein
MAIPERMEKRHQWYQNASRKWMFIYYTCVACSIVTPALASGLAFWKDSYPWAVALSAAAGAISSGVLAQFKPKTEWDNYRNAYDYFLPHITKYEDGLIGPEELNRAFAEAQRFVSPVPGPPSGQPPLPAPPPPPLPPPT